MRSLKTICLPPHRVKYLTMALSYGVTESALITSPMLLYLLHLLLIQLPTCLASRCPSQISRRLMVAKNRSVRIPQTTDEFHSESIADTNSEWTSNNTAVSIHLEARQTGLRNPRGFLVKLVACISEVSYSKPYSRRWKTKRCVWYILFISQNCQCCISVHQQKAYESPVPYLRS